MPTIKIKDNDIWKVVGAPSYADIEVDETLTQAGQAADAKAVGDALANAGSITIDLEGADDGEVSLVNADTLGGKTESELSVAKAVDCDTLGGISAEEYATENFVTDKIAEAQLSGEEVDLTGYATEAYVSEVVNNHKVDRAHLENDALYSPVKATSTATQYYFLESDLGKTVMPSSGANSSDITYILSDTLANSLPYGAEIAVCFRFGNSLKIKFEGEIYSAMVGDSAMLKAKTYQIPERYGMVALKKINYTDTYTSWLVTGNAEVV